MGTGAFLPHIEPDPTQILPLFSGEKTFISDVVSDGEWKLERDTDRSSLMLMLSILILISTNWILKDRQSVA